MKIRSSGAVDDDDDIFLMIAEDVCIDDAVIGPRGGEFLNGC